MAKRVPVRLGKEPLIEAVCELRVSTSAPLHTVLPGFLFTTFAKGQLGKPEQLPVAMVPDFVRDKRPEMAYATLIRMPWRDNMMILIGARSVALACYPPYAKWPSFRDCIANLFVALLDSGLVQGVDRYSIKYVNFFKGPEGAKGQTSMLDWHLDVGGIGGIDHAMTQLRLEIKGEDPGCVTVLSVFGSAETTSGDKATGGIVDVDTIQQHETNDIVSFKSELLARLDRIRSVNKQAFFDSLKQDAIDSMEPTYE